MTIARREKLMLVTAGLAFAAATGTGWHFGANLPQGLTCGFLATNAVAIVFTAMVDHARKG